jgi:uncharacterized membrane protein
MRLQRRARSVTVRVYPVELNDAGAPPEPASAQVLTTIPITRVVSYAGPPRYVVGLDLDKLVRHAAEADARVEVPLAIGDAVLDRDRLVIVHGGTRPIDERALREAIWLANERVVDNDPAYAIRLLVDIAIRALSPAVNDPTTAVNVLGELDGLLRVLGTRDLEDGASRDAQGVVRVVRALPSWEDYVSLALTEIHQYGRDAYQVQRWIATMLSALPEVLPPERHAALARFARWRERSLTSVVDETRGWLDPSAIDRQGLGHLEQVAVHGKNATS